MRSESRPLAKRFRQGPHEISNFIAHPAVMAQGLFLGLGGLTEFGRIVEADVQPFGFCGEKGAGFLGVAALNEADSFSVELHRLF